MRILLVEDNADHRELMCLALTGHDPTWQVKEVVSGEEALRHLAEGEAYDLVFLDYSLPGRDGSEVLEEIRRGEAPPPVVMVTGRGDERVAVEAMKGGAYDYVVKDEGYLQRLPVIAQRAVEARHLALERKRAEEALRENEERLQSLFETMTEGVVLIAPDGQIVQANPAAERILGLERSEIKGRNYTGPEWEILRPDRTPMPPEEMAGPRAMNEKRLVKDVVMGVKRPDGSISWINVGATPLINEAGRLEGVVGTFADITERKRAEEALERRASQLAVVNQVARRAASILDLDQLLQEVVTAIQQSFNYYHIGLFLLDEIAGELKLKATAGGFADIAPPDHRLALGEGMAGWAAQTSQSLLANDVSQEPRYVLGILKEALTQAELCVPLKLAGKVIGVLDIQSSQLNAFDRMDLMAMETLADQLAVAIENAQLYQETVRRLKEAETLGEVTAALTHSLDLDQVLQSIVDAAARLIPASTNSVIHLVDEMAGKLIPRATSAPGVKIQEKLEMAIGEGIAGLVVQEKRPINVPNVEEDPRFLPIDTFGPNKSLLTAPLLMDEDCLGTLSLNSAQVGAFSADDEWLLTTLAAQATVAVKNARLHQEVQRRVEELTFLNRVGHAMTSSLDLEQVLKTVMEETARVLQTEAGSALLLDEGSGVLVFQAVAGARSEKVKGLRLPLEQGIAGWVAREGQLLLVPDVREDPRFYSGIDGATGFVTRSILAVPLKVKGKVIGVIEAVNKTEGDFGQADVELLSSMTQSAAIAIENARLFEQAQREIAERKRTEWALREGERFLTSIFASIQDGLSILDNELNIISVNPAIERWYSYAMPLVGKKCYEAYHGRSAPCEVCPSHRTLETGEPAYEVVPKREAGGEVVGWLDLYSFPLVDVATGKVRGVIEYVRDITERKQAEEALRESERKLRLIAENMRDAVFAYDMTRQLLYVNPAFEILTGYTTEELYEQNFIKYIHPDDEARMMQLWEDLFQGKAFSGEEFCIVTKDGQIKWCSSAWSPLLDEEGRQIGVQGREVDITKRKRAEEAERNQRALAEALRDTAEALNSTLDFDEVLDRILANAGRVLPHDAADILLVDPAGIVSIARNRGYAERGLEGWASNRRFPLADFRSLRTIFQSGQPLAIPDTRSYVGWVDIPETRWILSYVCAPIRVRGQIVGFVSLSSTTPGFYTSAHTERLQAFANQAAIAIENARLYEQAQARSRYLETLHRINATLRSTLPLSQVLEMIAQGAGQALHYVGSLILVPDTTGQRLILGAAWGGRFLDAIVKLTGLEVASFGLPLTAEENPMVRAYLNGELEAWSRAPERIVVGVEPAISPKLAPVIERAMGARLAACVPLPVGQKVVGVLVVFSPREQLLDEEQAMLLGLADQAGLAIENAQLLEAVTSHERDLQRLSAQLINAQEAERKRISQELHDEMGQALTAMSINLVVIEKELPELAPTTRERLAETSSLADRTLEQVRELALDLRPSMLDDLGLTPTLRWYVNRYAKRLNIEAKFEVIDLEERLPAEMETVIYRVVQEALTNVARHARASRVHVRLDRKKSKVRALIEDDGQGFDVEEVAGREAPERGAGLLGIRERVTSLGGRFRIQSRPGRGTRLSLEIPII